MRAICLAFALLLSTHSAAAQDPDLYEVMQPVDRPSAEIAIQPDGEDLLVTIALEDPVSTLFLDPADVVRDDALQIETPGLSLSDNTISSSEPFSRVTFRLVEDLTERDAKYPPFYRVGPGRLIYLQAIYPDQTWWDIELRWASLPDGWTRWPDESLPQGYVYIGPDQEIIRAGGAQFVFDGNGSEEFEAEIREMVVGSLAHLTDMFGMPPETTPFFAASIIPSDRSFNTGDVTDSAMVGLRFMGEAPDPTAPGTLSYTRSLVLHEGVHFWNGGVAHFANGTPMWLHEGGAEYIATLSSYQLGWTDEEHLRGTFASWLERCRTSLGYWDEVALNDLDFIPSNLRYSCGPLLHLLGELYLAETSGGQTVAETWRDTVAFAAATDERTYTLEDWVSASGGPELLQRPALAALLATSGPERWDTINSEMARLGVESGEVTNPPLRARTALMFLIGAQCSELEPGQGYGFYSGPETYRLDTPPGCGLLTGNPVVATLGRTPVTTISAEDYAHMQETCASGGTIAFGKEDGEVIDVPCPGPLRDAATQPSISDLPDIPAFAR